MYESDTLTPAHLDVITKTSDGRPRCDSASLAPAGANHANLKICTQDLNLIQLPDGPFSLDEYIDSIIKKALILNEYNRTKTAKYLNITRRTLYTYLKRIEKISASQ